MTAPRCRDAALLGVLLAGAAYVVLGVLHGGISIPANDVYGYFLPNILHAVHGVHTGGNGLLWNPFQACGEPFLANPNIGLFYPPHLLFLALEPNAAIHAVLIINMVVGGVGMLLLGREIGLGGAAALGGALAFELGDPMVQLTGWSPMHNGPWAWLPWAFLVCERQLRVPSLGGVAALGVVLAVQLLPGFVLMAALTYQLIVLRVGWELLTRRTGRPWRSVAAIAAGLVLAPLLVAVQLVPTAELARESLRSVVPASDILKQHSPSALLALAAQRSSPLPFLTAPLVLAAIAPLSSARSRLAIFYLVTGTAYGVLALGDATPLLRLYVALPPGAPVLRIPERLFWVSGFCLAVLTALGLDALTRDDTPILPWVRSVVAALAAAALYRFAPGGLRWTEAVAVGATVAMVFLASGRSRFSRGASCVALGAVILNLLSVPLRWPGRLLPSVEPFWRHAATFAALRPPVTVQDRIYLMPPALRYDFMQKTATVLRIQDLSDFEALLGRRFAEYYTMMRKGSPLDSITDIYAPFPWLTPGVRRRLLDAAAVRYLVEPATGDIVDRVLGLPRIPVDAEDIHVYLNDRALARARYVPRVEVVRNPSAVLERLAYDGDDLETIAFVEEPPPSGFTGVPGSLRPGAARFVTSEPEHVVIDVDAPARGFLILADDYYPGWRATVNGVTVPLMRANYMFRLIEVPSGKSRADFRYRPTSFVLGAAVSLVMVGGLIVLLFRRRGGPFRALRGLETHTGEAEIVRE